MSIVIRGAGVLGGAPTDVLIEDGVVAAIGGSHAADEVIDGSGLVLLLATLGARVTLVAPPTLMPSGVSSWPCDTSWDLDSVLSGKASGDVDAVMMLRVQRERMSGGYFPTEREYAIGYGLSPERLDLLAPTAPVLHPGPMNRGLEIAADAADAAQSVVLEQVSAGVAVRMSVLYHLLAGEETA